MSDVPAPPATGTRQVSDDVRQNARSALPRSLRPRRSHFGWYALIVFLVALAVRGVYTWQLDDRGFLDLLIGDSRAYDAWGREIGDGTASDEVFPRAPLYPYLLGLLYALFDGDLLAAQIYHIILSSLSCLFLAEAGWRLFSKPAGLAAGLIMAFYGPALFQDGMIGPTALEIFLLCLLLWLFAELTTRPGKSLYLAFGWVAGCLILTRDTMVVLLPVLALWPIIRHRHRTGRGLAEAGLLTLGAIMIVTPAFVRNAVVAGEFRLTEPLLGPRFYLGNHAGASGYYEPLRGPDGSPDDEYLSPTQLAEKGAGDSLGPGEVTRYWFGRAWDDISAAPRDWLRLLARKFKLVCEATEVSEPPDQYTYAEAFLVLRCFNRFLNFGTLLPAAVLGLCVTWRHRRRLWPLYGMVAVYALTLTLLFVTARSRYLLVPILVLLAAAGLVRVRQFVRTRSPARLAGCLAAVTLVAVGIHWSMTSTTPMQARTHLELGQAMAQQGELRAAVAHCNHALGLDPGLSRAHLVLGNIYAYVEDYEEAFVHYEKAGSDRLHSPELHYEYASKLMRTDRNEEALAEYREATRLRPDWDLPLNDAAWMLATHPDYAGRRSDEAIRLAERACELSEHKDAMFVDTLAAAYASAGRFDEAVAMMEAALALPSAQRWPGLVAEFEARLTLFRQGKIYYEPPLPAKSQPATAPATSTAPEAE